MLEFSLAKCQGSKDVSDCWMTLGLEGRDRTNFLAVEKKTAPKEWSLEILVDRVAVVCFPLALGSLTSSLAQAKTNESVRLRYFGQNKRESFCCAEALSARLLICPYSSAMFKNSSNETLPSWGKQTVHLWTRYSCGLPGINVLVQPPSHF